MQKIYKKQINKYENRLLLPTCERQKEKETECLFSLKSEVSVLKLDNTALKLASSKAPSASRFRAI